MYSVNEWTTEQRRKRSDPHRDVVGEDIHQCKMRWIICNTVSANQIIRIRVNGLIIRPYSLQ